MQPEPLEQVVRNVDARLTRLEQILPTLATKAELKEAVAPLATRDEMHAAIAEAVARVTRRCGTTYGTCGRRSRPTSRSSIVASRDWRRIG